MEEQGVRGSNPAHLFHFKAFLGETFNEYVRRVRVERAAKRLIHHQDAITAIAFDCGFSSIAAFSRAFKDHFGISPSIYRWQQLNRKICKADRKMSEESPFEIEYDQNSEEAANLFTKRRLKQMKVEMKTFPTFHVAYVRYLEGCEGGVYNPGITQAFDKGGCMGKGTFNVFYVSKISKLFE